MAKEIERKFLIDPTHADVVALLETTPRLIRQGYIVSDPEKVVRVRVAGNQATLTIKGATTGLSRDEFEYPVPIDDAEYLLKAMCPKVIEKKRYNYSLPGGLIAEVDVFSQIVLYLAEVELPSEVAVIERPDWFKEDVSTQPQYYNSNLINFI